MKIKKFLAIILVCVFAIILVGCSDNQKLIELEKAIGDMQTTLENIELDKESLEEEIYTLQEELKALDEKNETQKQIIYDLRKKLEDAQKRLNDLNDQVESVKTGIRVMLADEYTLVVGDAFQLFYRSIVQAPDPYGYYIKVEGTKGHTFNRYYEFQPEAKDAGNTYTLKVSVCDANGVVQGTDTTKLVVMAQKISDGKNVSKNILCFGDSLTYNGTWVAQGISKYIQAGGNKVTTLGTMSATLNGVKVNYEGHSGWQWSTYINGEGTTPSPFAAKSGTGISFKDFCSKNGYSGIDEVYILLTWNGIGGRFKEFSFNDTLFSSAKIIIDKLHSEYPKAKVTLIGIPKPSTDAGLGAYYEITYGYGDNYAQSVTVMNYNQFMEDWCKMDEYKSFMFYMDGMGQFDSEYNMPSQKKPVNNQSSTTEPVGTGMGMHPNNSGYLQLGDVFFRALMRYK